MTSLYKGANILNSRIICDRYYQKW